MKIVSGRRVCRILETKWPLSARSQWSHVNDAGLLNLKGLTQLQRLNLSETKMSDAGLQQIKGLTALRSLNLDNTDVTDARSITRRRKSGS